MYRPQLAEHSIADAPPRAPVGAPSTAIQCTLLELIEAVCDETQDDEEVLATVAHLLQSGRVQLCGNLRGMSVSELLG